MDVEEKKENEPEAQASEEEKLQAAEMGSIVDYDPEKPVEEEPAPVEEPAAVKEKPAEKQEEPKAEPEAKPEPVVEPVAAPTIPEKEKQLAEDNERLRTMLNDMARQGAGIVQPAPVVATPPAATPVVPAGPLPSTLDFITDEEADSLIDKPKEVLNAVLNKVFQAGREQAMREMPTLVRQQALTEITVQQKVQKFWTDNKDLESYKDFCTMVANQVEVENPNLGFDEVLNETSKRVRERLKLTAVETPVAAPEPVVEPSASPALPTGPKAARRGPPPVATAADAMAQEMEDILKY